MAIDNAQIAQPLCDRILECDEGIEIAGGPLASAERVGISDRLLRPRPARGGDRGGQLIAASDRCARNARKRGGLWVARTPDLSDVNAAL